MSDQDQGHRVEHPHRDASRSDGLAGWTAATPRYRLQKRQVLALIALLLLASVAKVIPDGSPAQASDLAMQAYGGTQAASGDAADDPATGHYTLGSGDRLKLRIFERDDLSGEYRVRPNGNIVLPLAGAIPVEGRDETQVEQAVSNALQAITGGRATVTVEVEEWRPFYVAGYVTKPGAYAFFPGMTVLHAMAISGGVYRLSPGAETPAVVATRENGRMESTLDDLKRALARKARLEAERNGQTTLTPPARLREVALADQVISLLQDESRLLTQDQETYLKQEQALEETVRLASDESAAVKSKLSGITVQIEANTSVLSDLKELLSRQLTRRVRLVEASNVLSGLQTARQDALAALARAEKNRSDAERDLTLLTLRRRSDIEQQLQETQKQIEGLEQSVSSSRAVIETVTDSPVALQGYDSEPDIDYAILRRDRSGLSFVPASEETLMLPGDVLRVTRKPKKTAAD